MCSICAGGTCWCGSVGETGLRRSPSPEVGRVPRSDVLLPGHQAMRSGTSRGPGGPRTQRTALTQVCGIGDHRARRSARPWSSARQQSTRPTGRGSKGVLVGALPVEAGCRKVTRPARGRARSPMGKPRSPQPRSAGDPPATAGTTPLRDRRFPALRHDGPHGCVARAAVRWCPPCPARPSWVQAAYWRAQPGRCRRGEVALTRPGRFRVRVGVGSRPSACARPATPARACRSTPPRATAPDQGRVHPR
jgi:hypothetical protein